ncbi:MAG: hypothetical protein WD028_11805 [Balneolaceae bacterium]
MNVHQRLFFLFLFCGFMLLDGCYLFGTEDMNGPETPVYLFAAEVTPEGGGSVDPAFGEFEEGSLVRVEAQASDGWEFTGWSGDMESQDNPLDVLMEQDTELTAHFGDFRSVYTVLLRISNDEHELELAIGQNPQPFLLDRQAPPPPPEEALHGWFEREGESLFADYRSDVQRQVSWQLIYQPGSGEELTLSWSVQADKMEGDLRLLDDEGEVLVDRVSGEDEYTFTASDYDYLEFRYVLELNQ